MNKQSIPAKDLREIVTGFRKIVPRQSETLRQVKFDLSSGLMTVTDGSAFLSYQLGLRDRKGGSCFLPFDGLIHFAKGLPARQEVLFEAQADVATLTTVDRKCFAKPMKPEDSFESHPSFLGKAQPVTPDARTAILRAFTCASTDETRPVLQGAFFDNEGATSQVVGTDGRCLYQEPLQNLEIQKSFILPASPLLKWRGFGDDWQLRVSRGQKDPTMIQLTAGPWTFTVPAIEGNYPNWRQVIPDVRTRLSRLTLGKDDVATLRGMKGESIGFLSKPDEVRFVTFDKEANKWITRPAKDSSLKGPPSRVFVDPKFLKRALDAGVHEVCMADESDPVLFRGQGQLVVMPLRVNGPAFPGCEPKPKQQQPQKPMAPLPPKPMQRTEPTPSQTTPAQAVLESLRTLKGQLRESIGLVDESLRHLREMQVDHRATQKDIKTIRGTLQSLKKVAFSN
jgi:hypothetical protein